MCGICGELRLDDQPPDPDALERMLEALRQRGPDHGGCFTEGPIAFGHRRLSIIDLSERAHQPMQDAESGLSLVFNGVIYNYRELRRELAACGYRFFSEGDTEVILKAYHAWGRDCLHHLDGMFAFAIWDSRRQRLFLARDRFGMKPLYLTRDARRLRFASTLPALLTGGGVSGELDPVGLQFQFTLHGSVPAPHTVFAQVKKLPPASWLEIEANGATREERYWRLEARRPTAPTPEPDEAGYLSLIRERLQAAVQSHLLAADVPVGVLLSGGLDSSLLVALLAEQGQRDIPTFSIGFTDQPEESGNEFQYSDQVARHFATRHHRYLMRDDEMLDKLPNAIAAMSEPMFSQDNVAFYLLAREVKKEVKAVLSGQGADEVFGGYYWYPQMAATAENLPLLERFAPYYFDRSYAEYLDMLTPEWRAKTREDQVSAFIAARLEEPGADSFIDSVLRLDAATLIVDDPVKRVDNMTMAFGLEARVPFLDKSLVEAAMTLPPALRLREGGKFPLKHIARGLLPDAVIDRPKGYFPTPALKYLRGGFLDFIHAVLTAPACRERGLYNPAYVKKLLAEPLSHFTPLQGNKLWHLAALEYWLQTVRPGRY
ncbi:MAG: N-acetylglutaminylglutamine amidotransferase [Zoogloeaceae bacterium]|jgi:asparagine synthase (glutamine-hydrolysing)|nr:N-acetylglutaminylglutamine amidotransferase [Zoogloeaceae bacterium]